MIAVKRQSETDSVLLTSVVYAEASNHLKKRDQGCYISDKIQAYTAMNAQYYEPTINRLFDLLEDLYQ